MAWNDPDGNDRDPWGGRRNEQGPPDLDEVVRKMQEKLSALFGGKQRPQPPADNAFVWAVLGVVVLGLLAWEMVYRIDPAERGVVLRFGRYVSVLQPGPHIRFPRPIEEVRKINVERIETLTATSSMLTSDENIVDVEVAVQYRIKDPEAYLFRIADPDVSVQRVTESAIRDVIGQSTLDFAITGGRAEIAVQSQAQIQQMLDNYTSGIAVTSVNMQPIKPPEEVKAAFDDAIKAREDKERKVNEGEAYRNEIVERAQGEGARIRLDAEGYRERVIAQAEGEAQRFNQLLTEYEKAPQVTRERLYLETMEEVLTNTTKLLLDSKGGANVTYLPLDKLIGNANQGGAPETTDAAPEPPAYTPTVEESLRDRRIGRTRVVR
ncbi:MAG: FtsH protease activity modulator HflK [Gammaproteobacteria bacterium]|jgi:modulator of FtsH protease HflK|nr:FtsH protease activity modulator HflK [Gammaproteobacteria bacterium]